MSALGYFPGASKGGENKVYGLGSYREPRAGFQFPPNNLQWRNCCQSILSGTFFRLSRGLELITSQFYVACGYLLLYLGRAGVGCRGGVWLRFGFSCVLWASLEGHLLAAPHPSL